MSDGMMMSLYKSLKEYKSSSQRAKETKARKRRAKMPMTPERREKSRKMKLRWRQKRGSMMKGVKKGTKVRKMYNSVQALRTLDLTEDELDFRLLGVILDGINNLSSQVLKMECSEDGSGCEEKFFFYKEEIAPLYMAFEELVESSFGYLTEGMEELSGAEELATALEGMFSDLVEEGFEEDNCLTC